MRKRLVLLLVFTSVSWTTISAQSGVGGPCEGVAGFVCEPGLHCLLTLDNEFCETPPADLIGVCVQCPSDSAPVCDCNGVMYENACAAIEAGVTMINVRQCPVVVPATSPLGVAGLTTVLLTLASIALVRRIRRRRPASPA